MTFWVDCFRTGENEPAEVSRDDIVFDVPLSADALKRAEEAWSGPGKLESESYEHWSCKLGADENWQWTWSLSVA